MKKTKRDDIEDFGEGLDFKTTFALFIVALLFGIFLPFMLISAFVYWVMSI